MSVKALTWSFDLGLRDMAAKGALNALADHADAQGRCWPSITRIARWAGCDEKTARRALQRLTKWGAVSRESRTGHSDMFTINFGWVPPEEVSYPSQNGEGAQIDTPPTATPPPSQDGSTAPPTVGAEPSVEPSKNPHSDKRPRASQLPQDWKPTPAQIDYCRKQGCPNPHETATDFREHWWSRGGRMVDWNLTWQTWCRRERQFKGYAAPRSPQQGGFNL